jgi:hypothetical protein
MKSIFFLLLISTGTMGQATVQDKANKGQFQRMVSTRWDNWQPDPSTTWLGVPKNAEGWFYWRVLHHDYWDGEDQRPYKPGSQFDQNYASLSLQEKDDEHIADSLEAVFHTNMVNYTNMQGGNLDLPYQTYFGKVFDKLTTAVTDQLPLIAEKAPAAFNGLTNNKHFQEYLNFITEVKDRIQVVHSVLVDKGTRIVSYLQIKKEIEKRNAVINAMINIYVNTSVKLPQTKDVQKVNTKQLLFNNDKEIVNHILSTFLF